MPYKEGNRWRGAVKHRGERLTKSFALKKEAVAWETTTRKDLKKNARKRQQGMDLLSFCSKYLDYANRYRPKVYAEKRSVCKRILKEWGSETVVELITEEMVEAYLAKQKKERSANAANKDRKNLLAMWGKGVKTYGLTINVFSSTDKFPHDRKPQYTPPVDDVLALLMAATRKERVFLDAYLQTGARRSEIFRWTWVDDINFEKREYRLGTRKTKDGSMEYEWFPMSDDLFDSLSWWWKNRTIKESPYVFTDDQEGSHYGKRYSERRRFMHGLCKRADIKPFGFHALRRFVASVLADAGKSTNTIKRILRHKNLATTERYIHNINNDLKEATGALSISSLQGHKKGHEESIEKAAENDF